MPYDLYDYFLKQRNSGFYTQASDIVRENVWRESINVVQSQEWLKIEDQILIKLYVYLRYN